MAVALVALGLGPGPANAGGPGRASTLGGGDGAVLDHFLCYEAETTPAVCAGDGPACAHDDDCGGASGSCVDSDFVAPGRHRLRDRFEVGEWDVGEPQRLCLPVDKRYGGATTRASDLFGTHLEGYQTELAGEPPATLYPLDCSPCEGGVTRLVLEYLGSARAEVVMTDSGARLLSSGELAPGDTVVLSAAGERLRSPIEIRVEDGAPIRVDTSCSRPIGPGMLFGDFRVVAGESRDGELPLCPAIRVENQIESLFVATGAAELLMVPTAKSLHGFETLTAPEIDPFKCYDVRAAEGHSEFVVRLTDQFRVDRVFQIDEPRRLCVPVSVDGAVVQDPDTHQLCYEARLAPGSCHTDGSICSSEGECAGGVPGVTFRCRLQAPDDRIAGLFLNNPFGDERLDIAEGRELCVPSHTYVGAVLVLAKRGRLDLAVTTPGGVTLVKEGTLDLGPDGRPSVGDLIRYTFEVRNTGSRELTSVFVSDPLVGAVSCPGGNPIPALRPGASRTCTGSYAIRREDVEAGVRKNVASATGFDPDGNAVTDVAATEVPIRAREGFFCDATEAFIVQGTSAELSTIDQTTRPFTFNPVANLESPPGRPIEVNNMGFRATDRLFYAVEVDLAANRTRQVIRIDQQGRVTGLGLPAGLPENVGLNAGDVSADGNTMFFTHHGSSTLWTVDLSALPSLPLPAADAIPIVGASGGAPPRGVVLDWAFNPADGRLYGADRDGTGSTAQIAQLDPRTGVRRDFLVTGLPAGAPNQYGGAWFDTAGRLFVLLNSGAAFEIELGPDLDNPSPVVVRSQASPASSRNDAAACVPPQSAPSPVVVSGPSEKLGGVPQPGDRILYAFEVINAGSEALTRVLVSDPMVPAILCPSGNPIPVLPPGTVEICSGTYAITQADIEAGRKVNTATATSDQAGPVQSTHVEPIPRVFRFELTKRLESNADEDGSGDVTVGDTLTYLVVGTNRGNGLITGVKVRDPLPGLSPLACTPEQPAALAPGQALTCTATYVVRPADVLAGSIENTVTAWTDQTPDVPASATVPVTGQPPVACEGDAFLVQNLTADLSLIDQSQTPFAITGGIPLENPPGTPIEVNALGWRSTDGLLYAAQVDLDANRTAGIIQIDGAGRVTPLGVPPGLPTSVGLNGGDISLDGRTMYLTSHREASLWRLDLSGLPALPLPPVGRVPITGRGGGASPSGIVLDWAFNPIDGKLYGADRDGNGVDAEIAQLDPATGERRDFLVPGLEGGAPRQYGGAWFNPEGQLFVYLNSGTIFEIDLGDLAAPRPTIVRFQSGPGSSRNDTASCLVVPEP